jgi:hypothetical protein
MNVVDIIGYALVAYLVGCFGWLAYYMICDIPHGGGVDGGLGGFRRWFP